ncbi:MAG: hypothetical protein ABI597_06685 [Gammaproteobacteria bacterium]
MFTIFVMIHNLGNPLTNRSILAPAKIEAFQDNNGKKILGVKDATAVVVVPSTIEAGADSKAEPLVRRFTTQTTSGKDYQVIVLGDYSTGTNSLSRKGTKLLELFKSELDALNDRLVISNQEASLPSFQKHEVLVFGDFNGGESSTNLFTMYAEDLYAKKYSENMYLRHTIIGSGGSAIPEADRQAKVDAINKALGEVVITAENQANLFVNVIQAPLVMNAGPDAKVIEAGCIKFKFENKIDKFEAAILKVHARKEPSPQRLQRSLSFGDSHISKAKPPSPTSKPAPGVPAQLGEISEKKEGEVTVKAKAASGSPSSQVQRAVSTTALSSQPQGSPSGNFKRRVSLTAAGSPNLFGRRLLLVPQAQSQSNAQSQLDPLLSSLSLSPISKSKK